MRINSRKIKKATYRQPSFPTIINVIICRVGTRGLRHVGTGDLRLHVGIDGLLHLRGGTACPS